MEVQAINRESRRERWQAYRHRPLSLLLRLAVTLSAAITVFVLIALVAYILIKGIPNLKPSLFAWKYTTENVSMLPAIINTITMTVLSLLMAVPVGVCSAIYLVEYAKRGNKLVSLVRVTAETLQGIPSIVYGLFGYLFLVIACGFGYSLLSGAITLAIMILPLILRTAEEALGVLREIEAACGLAATAIVNNSNLGRDTAAKDVLASLSEAARLSRLSGLPVRYTAVDAQLAPALAGSVDRLLPIEPQSMPIAR